ncbi:phosphatase PAP2 family protein, partial [Streptomyces reticuliscabiei]
RYGGTRTTKVLAVAYPLITTIVVMGTANHYFLDAVAGAAVMGLGLLLAPLVIRNADRARVWITARVAPVATLSRGAEAPIVSGECQTSPRERIPRQRESVFGPVPGPGAEPGAASADAGDGAAAAAR